jgi:hypothetical protein
MFTIECDKEYYRLIGPNQEEGECSEYGDPAYLEIDGVVHFCIMNGRESGEEFVVPQVFVLEQDEELEPACDIDDITVQLAEFDFPDDDQPGELVEDEEAAHG